MQELVFTVSFYIIVVNDTPSWTAVYLHLLTS